MLSGSLDYEPTGYRPIGLPREQVEGLGIYEWRPDIKYHGGSDSPSKPSYALRQGRLYRSLTTNTNVKPEESFEWVRVIDTQEFYRYGSAMAIDNAKVPVSDNLVLELLRLNNNDGFTVDVYDKNHTKLFDTTAFSNCMFYVTKESTLWIDATGDATRYTLDVEVYFNGIKIRNVYIQPSEVLYSPYTLNGKTIEDDRIPSVARYDFYIQNILDMFFGGRRVLTTSDTIEFKVKSFAIPLKVSTPPPKEA